MCHVTRPNFYSKGILRDMSEVKCMTFDRCNINNLRFADDIVLVADSGEELQEMINIGLTNRHSEARILTI